MAQNRLNGNKSAKGQGFDGNPQNINSTGKNRKSIASVNKELEEKGYQSANKKDIETVLKIFNNFS